MQVTFHRAFDMCKNLPARLQTLIELGIDRLLTSGGESNCLEGMEMLKDLQQIASSSSLKIVAGGGITKKNLPKILEFTQIQEFHTSGGRTTIESKMQFKKTQLHLGGSLFPPEFSVSASTSQGVSGMIQSAQK